MAKNKLKMNKFLTGAVTATMVATAVVPMASANVAATKEFTDVAATDSHYQNIMQAVERGLFKGYPNGTFKPYNDLTRGNVAKVLANYVVSQDGSADYAAYIEKHDLATNSKTFTDVPATTTDKELFNASLIVKAAGIFDGSNNNLMPAKTINRQQMAKVLVNAFGLQDLPGDLSTVTDNNKAFAEFVPFINILSENRVTEVSTYNPLAPVKRAQMASFLNRAFDIAKGALAPTVASVKAINATTVEVTMKEKAENIGTFTIEGLTVSNAAVKQSDDKVVVLTTAVQEGGKKYTVKIDGNTIGTFDGVSAVIPTKIDITTQSVQGKVGAQAILTADVGVKQAGIPVTFNVKAETSRTLNKDQVFEAVTNAEGIATFSYTQYAAGTDAVVAYPTGARTVQSLGYVFWGVDTILAIEEVTTDKAVNNGANKTYKVTFKDAHTGKPTANETLNVSFVENLNVTSDKLANASVNGVAVAQINNNTLPKTATITTDSKGEATFTVSGTNTEVTPVVFAQNLKYGTSSTAAEKATYEASLLQAQATKVKFEALQAAYTIELTRDGGEVAATEAKNGRKYNVVVKDKDGKIAKNEVVNVAFNEDLDRVISTVTTAKFVKVSGSSQAYYPDNKDADGQTAKQITVKTNDKGEASFVIGSDKVNDYGTPVAWIDVNTPNAKDGSLDEGEPKTVGAISYFVDAYLDGSALKSYKGSSTASEFKGNETATFKASLVNQSNKDVAGTSIKKVSYTIFNEGANDVQVGTQVISPNRSFTVTYDATKGENTNLEVSLVQDKTGKVRVVATGIAVDTNAKDYAFTAKEATASFTATRAVSALYTGKVASFNSDEETLTFDGKDAVDYTGTDYSYRGLGNTPIATAADFITELKKGEVTVTREVKDGSTTFYIIEQKVGTAGPQDEYKGDVVAVAKKALTDAVTAANARNTAAVEGNDPGQYTTSVKTAYQAAIATADAAAVKANATEADLKAATAALATATATFVAAVNPEKVGDFEFTATTVNTTEVGFGLHIYTIEGTVAGTKADKVTSVKIVFAEDVLPQEATYNATTGKFTYKETVSKFENITIIAYDANGEVLSKVFPVTFK